MDEITERKYSIHDGEVTVLLPAGYSSKSIEDLLEYLAVDKMIQKRREMLAREARRLDEKKVVPFVLPPDGTQIILPPKPKGDE